MPLVRFESTQNGTHLELHCAPGTRLVDVCDEHGAPVPFSCRSASCGTCRVDVLEGGDLLEPPEDEELQVLELFGDDPARRRLACQARLGEGAGRVRLRATEPRA